MSQANQTNTTSARAEAMRREKMRLLAKRLPTTEADIGGVTRLTVDARGLHYALGILRGFDGWVRDRIVAHRLDLDADYVQSCAKPGLPQEYRLTTEAAKAMCFGACPVHGGAVRRYLNDAERTQAASRKAFDPSAMLSDPALLRRLLLEAMEQSPPATAPPVRRNQAERAMHPDELVLLDMVGWYVGMTKGQVCAAMAEMGWMPRQRGANGKMEARLEIPTEDGVASGAVAMVLVDRTQRLALTQDGINRLKEHYAHAG